MPFNYHDIMQAQWQRIEMESAQANAELEASRLRDDADGTNYAANRILELDAQRSALAQRATQYAGQLQNRPQGSRYGLTEAARSSFGSVRGAPEMTDDQREELYARQKAKLQHMRATGQYHHTTERG